MPKKVDEYKEVRELLSKHERSKATAQLLFFIGIVGLIATVLFILLGQIYVCKV
jgi:hypothetical protein